MPVAEQRGNIPRTEFAARVISREIARHLARVAGGEPNFNDVGPTARDALGVARSVARQAADPRPPRQTPPVSVRLSYSNRLADDGSRVSLADSELVAEVKIGDGPPFLIPTGTMAIPEHVPSDWDAVGQLVQEETHPSILEMQRVGALVRDLTAANGINTDVNVNLDSDSLFGQVMLLRERVGNHQIDPKFASGLLGVVIEIDRVRGREPVEVLLRWDFGTRGEDGVTLPDMMIFRNAKLVAEISVGDQPSFTVSTEIPRFVDGRPDRLAEAGQTQSVDAAMAEVMLDGFTASVHALANAPGMGAPVGIYSSAQIARGANIDRALKEVFLAMQLDDNDHVATTPRDPAVADVLDAQRRGIALRTQLLDKWRAARDARVDAAIAAQGVVAADFRLRAAAERLRSHTVASDDAVVGEEVVLSSGAPSSRDAGAPLQPNSSTPSVQLQQARPRRVMLVVGDGGDVERAMLDAQRLAATGTATRAVGQKDDREGHLFGVTVVRPGDLENDGMSWHGRVRDFPVADTNLDAIDLGRNDAPDLVIAYGNVGPHNFWLDAPVESRDGLLGQAMFDGHVPIHPQNIDALNAVMAPAHDPIPTRERAVSLIA